jgi:hypothetical protein
MDQITLETSRKDIAQLMTAVSVVTSDNFDIAYQPEDEQVQQAGGLYEAVFLLLQDKSWIAIGGAAMGVVGAEVVKDLYKQIKTRLGALFGLFKPESEQLGVTAYLQPRGRRVEPVWEEGPNGPVQTTRLYPLPVGVPDEMIKIQYVGRMDENDPYVFDLGYFEAAFDTYEKVVCPLIAYWRQQGDVCHVWVEGSFGPGLERSYWSVSIATDSIFGAVVAEIAIRAPR